MVTDTRRQDCVHILTEFLVAHGEMPDFRLLSSNRMQQENFKYQATGLGVVAIGNGATEGEAKQDAAKQLLFKLTRDAVAVQADYIEPENELVS